MVSSVLKEHYSLFEVLSELVALLVDCLTKPFKQEQSRREWGRDIYFLSKSIDLILFFCNQTWAWAFSWMQAVDKLTGFCKNSKIIHSVNTNRCETRAGRRGTERMATRSKHTYTHQISLVFHPVVSFQTITCMERPGHWHSVVTVGFRLFTSTFHTQSQCCIPWIIWLTDRMVC